MRHRCYHSKIFTGYPGIPANPERPEASIQGVSSKELKVIAVLIIFPQSLEVRLGTQPVTAKWVRLEFRKVETIPSGKTTEEFVDHIGPGPITIWEPKTEQDLLASVLIRSLLHYRPKILRYPFFRKIIPLVFVYPRTSRPVLHWKKAAESRLAHFNNLRN